MSKKEKPKVAKKVSKLSDFKSMGDMLNTVDVKIKKQERHKQRTQKSKQSIQNNNDLEKQRLNEIAGLSSF